MVIIDEAQNLSADMLEEVRLLTNLETDTEKLLQLVLSGQPELEQRLREPRLRQLRQRIALWCRTLPLTAEQTQSYIHTRLQIAGRADELFDPAAAREVYRFSSGIPRLINLLCEHSLLLGYAEQEPFITASTVRAVAEDLELEPRFMDKSSGTHDRKMSASGRNR